MKKLLLIIGLILYSLANAYAYGETVWNSNGQKIYYDDGNVGIGTTDPGSALEVVGNIAGTTLTGTTLTVTNAVFSNISIDDLSVIYGIGASTADFSQIIISTGLRLRNFTDRIEWDSAERNQYITEGWGIELHGNGGTPIQLPENSLMIGYDQIADIDRDRGRVYVSSGIMIGTTNYAEGRNLYVVGGGTITDDLHVDGNFTNGKGYLHAYFVHTDTGTTTLAADTWAIVVGTYTSHIGNNFTVSGATVTYTGTHTKSFSFSFAMSISASGGDNAYWKFTKNGVVCPCSRQERKVPVNDIGGRGLNCACTLSTGDELSLYCKTTGGADLTHLALSVVVTQMD